MKVVVFGGSGFLGSYVSDELSKAHYDVTIYDLNRSLFLSEDQNMIVGDILDPDSVREAVRGADIVYNFAGFANLNESLKNPTLTMKLNIIGNLNILEACVSEKVEHFIYASTVYVSSRHGSFYGISKRTSEQIIEEFTKENNIKFTIIRYGSIFGERADKQNRIYRIIKEALETQTITFLGNGEEEREYIHARDAAKLSVDIIENKEAINQRYILTGVERFSYKQLLQMINEMLGGHISINFQNKDYKGHYTYTPYSYSPQIAKKLVANPFLDFGQGLLETIKHIDRDVLNKIEL